MSYHRGRALRLLLATLPGAFTAGCAHEREILSMHPPARRAWVRHGVSRSWWSGTRVAPVAARRPEGGTLATGDDPTASTAGVSADSSPSGLPTARGLR